MDIISIELQADVMANMLLQVRVADVLGDLYCCSEDRCNSADRLRVNLTSDHTCFIGTAVMNGTRPYKIQGLLFSTFSTVYVKYRQAS